MAKRWYGADMSPELMGVRTGAVPFTQFARATRQRWQMMARWLYRRWPLPGSVEREDIEQELMFWAWHFVGKWDPNRGVAIDRYVVWNAMDKAKKWLHVQRGAIHRRDNDKSCFFNSISDMAPGWETKLELVADAAQSEEFDRMQGSEQLLAVCTMRDEFLLRVFMREKDPDEAADVVYRDPKLRLAFRFNCIGDARSRVRKAAHNALRRMEDGC